MRPRARLKNSVAVLAVVLWPAAASARNDEGTEPEPTPLNALPARSFLCQRNATEFCPPNRAAFEEAATAFTGRTLRGKVAVPPLNGGYGVRLDVGGGTMLLTCGAELGWIDTGKRVFAVADGVVRGSQPGLHAMPAEQRIRKTIRGPGDTHDSRFAATPCNRGRLPGEDLNLD